jgi:stearoyl-CoA desaturase (delta-9 desaturase)
LINEPEESYVLFKTVTRGQKIVNLIGVFLPFAGLLAAVVLLWNSIVGWHDLAIMLTLYVFTGLGVTVGYHRYFTHRSFQTYRPIRYTLAVAGSLSLQGSPIKWVADHRKHHTFTDEEGDPHSPHLSGSGIVGTLKGLYHAHIGWLFETVGQADERRFARDLLEDPGMRAIERAWPALAIGTFVIPFVLGFVIAGSLAGALTALLWGGFVRVFLLHHVTWSINSVCHFFGRRRFESDDHSTNVFWLAPLSFGESWHHNHHAFPRSAFHGLRWWEIDPSALVIRALERMRLAWDVVRISPEKQREKALAQ